MHVSHGSCFFYLSHVLDRSKIGEDSNTYLKSIYICYVVCLLALAYAIDSSMYVTLFHQEEKALVDYMHYYT